MGQEIEDFENKEIDSYEEDVIQWEDPSSEENI